MACRGLYVFTHENPYGNAPAHKLFERIDAERKPDVSAPRSFRDYTVILNDENLPDGITLTRIEG